MNPIAIIGILVAGFLVVTGLAYTGVGLPSQNEPWSVRQDSVGNNASSTHRSVRGGSTNFGK